MIKYIIFLALFNLMFMSESSTLNGTKRLNDLFDNLSKNLDPIPFTLKDFGDGFVFGASSSAYQYEGAAAEDGRGPSIWDDFALKNPDKIDDGATGNVAINQYKMFKEDVKLIKSTGLSAYRFSISWSRILPGGTLSAGINKEGIKYYNDLINALLAEGIEPYVTLFHWDLPLALQQEYGGFLSEQIVSDFRDYAELCFFYFGDRVKYWITFNEAWTYTFAGYVAGTFPPGRSFASEVTLNTEPVGHRHTWKQYSSQHGDPCTEPYIVGHNFILAHAAAVATYRIQFQAHQGGKIGMANVINWYEPLDPSSRHDQEAAKRGMDFEFGWFVAPLVTGDYPKRMKDRVKSRLPVFTKAQAKVVKGSYDFIGVNYYTSNYVEDALIDLPYKDPNYISDKRANTTAYRNGVIIGPQAASSWLYIVPRGIYSAMDYIRKEYNNPEIYITENGVDTLANPRDKVEQERDDSIRIDYFRDHLSYVKRAIADKIKIKGFFLWSLCDNYEWNNGYTVRFGIFYVDFMDGRLTRYPKRSALWWANFLGSGSSNKNSSKKRT